ncbi:hypothetical protein AXG93_1504s1160 [Marchantia polymorpha subsp. ruderalis]|uniref:FBD domain-containing protein n=1 Tax=Marchantia polymorpha subsp. ruderalis TaxID=1480154 RepID=A0A176VR02_MARPO|nr:hypothetical protein AXG93_1504s1160 [Marchantia polymorpha subsp. ruderalis]
MEGAGASIDTHAAETRGMESADEDAKLPSTIEDLIRRLEGKGEPITRLHELTGTDFRDFFPERELLSTVRGWRSQVRLRVLDAIGNCDTLEDLNLEFICGGDISTLTVSEWEIVLRGFRCSTVLEMIRLQFLSWGSDAEVESLCSQLGTILNTSSVAQLSIDNCRLSARCFLNLASGLRGNVESNLKYLDVYRAWKDSSAVKHVADMINSATRLKTLVLGYIDNMEEETVGILSQALIKCSSLKELKLERVDKGEALLLKALAGDDGNRSIERLRLERMDRLGGCFRELLTSNPSLKELTLVSLRMSPEEWRQLCEVIRDRARATNIIVQFSGRVLRGEIKSLKSFSIFAGEFSMTDTNQDRIESMLSMNGKTGEASVLKSLLLSFLTYKSKDLFKGVWKYLFWCLRGNISLTHLDLGLSHVHEESFRDLMGLLQVNLTIRGIDASRTTWARDGKAAQIQEALNQNQQRAVYMSVFREAKLAFGYAKAGRLFLCGSHRAGNVLCYVLSLFNQ